MIHYLKIVNFGPVKDEAELNFEVGNVLIESIISNSEQLNNTNMKPKLLEINLVDGP